MSRSIVIPLMVIFAGIPLFVSTDTQHKVCAKTTSIVPKDLLESRLAAARKVFELNMQKLRSGEIALNVGVLEWSQRWLDAELALRDNPADKIVALKAHLERAKELEKIATAHTKAGQGLESDAQAATYFRIDAEIRLRQAASE